MIIDFAICVLLFFGLIVPTALLLVQTLAASNIRSPNIGMTEQSSRTPIVVLIPAHDEEAGIVATLSSVFAQTDRRDRVVVIADNCTDHTASVAATCGAEVIERTDLHRRGKGYALQFGFDHVRAAAPEIILMFDADCIVGPGCIAQLAVAADRRRRPIQSRYLLRAADDGIRARVGEFAFRLRNWVRPLGMSRFDMPTQLTGSGMAFHRSLLEKVDLASGHLTEDLQLGLRFARLGLYPLFCAQATVDSRLAADRQAAISQRTRWEHGHLSMIVSTWPGLIVDSVRHRDVRLFAMALDLFVPPLALLLTTLSAVGVACVVAALLGASWWPTIECVAAMILLNVAIVIAQRCFARDLLRLREIYFAAPVYLLRKIPLYARFLIGRQVAWVRTKRDVR